MNFIKLPHRGYHPRFYCRFVRIIRSELWSFCQSSLHSIFAGLVKAIWSCNSGVSIWGSSPIASGAMLKWIGPQTSLSDDSTDLYNGRHERVDVVHPGTGRAYIRMPQDPGNMPYWAWKTEPVKETIIVQSDLVQALNSQIQAADTSVPLDLCRHLFQDG